jgi:hypothetical protein
MLDARNDQHLIGAHFGVAARPDAQKYEQDDYHRAHARYGCHSDLGH